MTKEDVKDLLLSFWAYRMDNGIEIYNEFSFQHELGIYLREKCQEYKVQFERNVDAFNINRTSTVKKEIDIVIFNGDTPASSTEKYAIELKFPRNGQVPEEMYQFITDIMFLEQLKNQGFDGAFAFVLVDYKDFWSNEDRLSTDGIYGFYRNQVNIHGEIRKPTGEKNTTRNIVGNYTAVWENTGCDNEKYHLITF